MRNSSANTAPTPPSSQLHPEMSFVADLLVFNGEISMLRYRLLLHAAFVQRTVIFETNVTFAGHAKVQHAAMQLTDEERSWYNITLPACTVPRGNRHTVPWLREFALRMEMAEWAATQLPPGSFAFVSDVDELLDPATMPPSLPLHGLLHTRAGCVAPSLRHWYYSERCPAKRPWHDAVLFRVDGAWFMHHMTWLRSVRPQLTGRLPFKTDSLPLRKAGSEHCPHSLRTARPSYMGWHLSYALNTQQILSKLRENSHANDSMVRKVLDLPLPEAFVNRSVASCADLFGRAADDTPNPERSPLGFDGRVPLLPGWPRAEAQLSWPFGTQEPAPTAPTALYSREHSHPPLESQGSHSSPSSLEAPIVSAQHARELSQLVVGLIIELNQQAVVEYVMGRVSRDAGGIPIIWMHGESNADFARKAIARIRRRAPSSQAVLSSFRTRRGDSSEAVWRGVNEHILSPTLWQHIVALKFLAPATHAATHVLMFETDSCTCSQGTQALRAALEYSYCGAPWVKPVYGMRVGNGGLSLWHITTALQLTTQREAELQEQIRRFRKRKPSVRMPIIVSDAIFARWCTGLDTPRLPNSVEEIHSELARADGSIHNQPKRTSMAPAHPHVSVCPYSVAQAFSVETVDFYGPPFGVHKPWVSLPRWQNTTACGVDQLQRMRRHRGSRV